MTNKFNIYCLINSGKQEEAQLFFDLKKELGFKDKYFENKINYLLGISNESDNKISEKTILDFHLAHKTNSDFDFSPNDNTSKIIWKYLASSNLLSSVEKIDISELEKISTLEKRGILIKDKHKRYSHDDLTKGVESSKFTSILNYNINLLGIFFADCLETYSGSK